MLQKLLGVNRRPKVFCIGRNKTGTTSLGKALNDLGFQVGVQAAAEMLMDYYAQRNFRPIVEYCRKAEAFQDVPFSLPYTYQIMDHEFPGSRFILSVRDDEDEWYRSFIRFHQKRLRVQRRITKEDLINDPYRYKGYLWKANRITYETPEDDPYNEGILKEFYLRHNADIIKYFRFRSDLLVINLKQPGSYQAFCDFLAVEPIYAEFPWLNRSA